MQMEILKQLANFGKSFEKLGNVGKIAVLGAAAFIAFAFGECNNHDKLVQFQIKYEQLQKEVKIADSLKTKVAVLTSEANNKDTVIKRLTVSLQTQKLQRQKLVGNLEVLEDNLKFAKDTAELVQVQQGIIYNLKEQLTEADKINETQSEVIQNQQYKIVKLNEALELSNIRGDRLQESLDKFNNLKMPTPKKPFISKKTAGIIAFVGGVVVGNTLAK